MKREKVVCFVSHAAETGGAEFALFRLVAEMDRSEWTPVVVFSEDGPAVNLFREQSVETYVIPLDASVGKVRRESLGKFSLLWVGKAWACVRYIFKLSRFFRERAAEIVHTNSMKAHVLGGLAAKLSGVPLVWHLRDSLHPLCLPPLALRLMRFLALRLPDKLVTVSKSVARDALGANGGGRALVVYDGVDADCFSVPPPDTLKSASSQNWTVGIVGRLCEWKGQHLFLEAAADLIERGLPVRFEVLGGPLFGQEAYAERLRQFVKSSGLATHVSFHGFVSDVPKRIRAWDLLVHASTAPDPCPNVVIEAMAAGVPVVAADGGGVPELLDYGACGLLFPMGDARRLSWSIESALKDPALRMRLAVAARHRAERSYQSGRVTQELASVWRGLACGGAYARRAWPWIEDAAQGPVAMAKSKTKIAPSNAGVGFTVDN